MPRIGKNFLLLITIFIFLPLVEAFGGGYFPGGEVIPETEPYWYLAQIRAYEAQQLVCGEGVTVVLIDSGVDPENPDLAPNLRLDLAYDFGDNDTDVTDALGHGTATAGLILQVAPCAKILPLKINRDGEAFFETEALLRALQYTLSLIPEHPEIRIVNLSLVLQERSDEVARLIKEIRRSGVLIVGAAGNEGASEIAFPASLPEVLAVSGTDIYDEATLHSNHGDGLFLSAPADNLYVPSIFGGYTYMSGTSMAAALVSGTLALELDLSREVPEWALAEGSKDLGPPGYDTFYGFGRLSVLGSILADLSRDLPLLPSKLSLLPRQERKVFFLPQENLKTLVLDNETVEITTFKPDEGFMKIKGKAPGETEVFLYSLSPLRASRLKVSVKESEENQLEVLVYPFTVDREAYICCYASVPEDGNFTVTLYLTALEGGKFVRNTLWSYSGPLSAGNYWHCLSVDPALFKKGLQETLLCGYGFNCTRHLFYVDESFLP